ncbi:hypothetical protein FK531_07365 [Rhodococcus spelaei]|uniref:Amidohydrolase n=1 Tax=Rhodococcus spelaei TaxID=2546320 RepID=A0A541BMZ2_9NOCA|nr:hypothetical protein FK531_07365 [Rhodococcus spelaei]
MGLVDHHCHGVLRDPLDRDGFESWLCEADGPGRWHGTMFDTQAGLAVRRFCAAPLGLAPHAGAEDYLARRAELGPDEVARRLLRAAGISEFLVDTGFRGDSLTLPNELAALAGAPAREIVRLESVAERMIVGCGATEFAESCRDALATAAVTAVAFKSIAGYRVGLDLAPDRPAASEVADAAARWASNVVTGAGRVLAELLELAPLRSVLFSTDGCGLPELFLVGAELFRRALSGFLVTGLADDAWSRRDAERIATLIAANNARRLPPRLSPTW